MTDTLSRLLAVEPLPRGERLARWSTVVMDGTARGRPVNRLWRALWWESLLGRAEGVPSPASIRAHARPLRLAREKARRLRAELFKAWAWEQELSSMHRQEKDRADRAEADLHHPWTATSEWYRHQWCDAEKRADRAEAKLVTWERRWQRMLYKQRAWCKHAAVWQALCVAANTRRGQDNPEVRGPVHRVAMREATRARIALHAAGRGVPG